MSVLEAVFLGVVQGVTEWLPISSSTHLVIVPALLGRPHPDLGFITFLHLGTFFGLLAYFARDLVAIASGALRGTGEERRLVGLLVLATLPGAAVGFFYYERFDRMFEDPAFVAFSLLATAGILAAAETLVRWSQKSAKAEGSRERATLRDAITMGLAQVTALFPGVSRSGVTMAAGLGGGLSRPAAARFSFLMAIPIVGAATLYELPIVLRADPGGVEAAGFLASLVAGYASVAWLLRFLRGHSFWPFAGYCALVAVVSGLVLS